jgi:hypothetical protein
MAEYKLGRIRFVWKGDWVTGTTYYKDDVVRVGGRTFICQIGHSSSADFNTDLDFNPTKWNQLTDGESFQGDWSTSTFYQIRDVVKYGGLLYICNDSHTSASTATAGLEADQAKWTLFAEGTDWKGDWSINSRYKVNDIVRYGGYTYICNTYHTSAATSTLGLEADQANWDVYNPGIEFKGAWSGSFVRYKLNDVVKQGAGLWICTQEHTSTASFIADSATYWSEFVKGIEFENAWNIATTYQPGDIVVYGGNQYISKTNHVGSLPSVNTTDWALFSEGFNFSNAWSISSSYRIGDVITQSGYAYLATQDSPSFTITATSSDATSDSFTVADTTELVSGMAIKFSGVAFGGVIVNATYYIRTVLNSTTFTTSDSYGGALFQLTTASGTMTANFSAHPTNTSYWQPLVKGINWRNGWEDDVEYDPGDVVRFGSNAYICILKHRSEGDDGSTIGPQGGGAANSRPDLDSAGTYWNILVVGSEVDVLTTTGDLVFYGGAGPTRLPVGREGQVLRVSSTEIPEWVSLGHVDHVYYVATHGLDSPAPIYGKSFDKPFKTIRYACEQVEHGPRNPGAKTLLELNRVFIQRETSKWIEYQVANNISPFSNVTVTSITSNNTLNTATAHGLTAGRRLRAKITANGVVAETDYYVISAGLTTTAFRLALTSGGTELSSFSNGTGLSINLLYDFDEYKCERDVGFIVDALIYDLGHGGNVKTRGAANSYVGGLSPGETEPYLSGLGNEDSESVAALTYMLSLVENVLDQEAPAVNYQVLNGDNSTAIVDQYFDADITAETGAYTTSASLVGIVTDAIIAGDPDDIPARVSPTNLVRVATGQYKEVLPIIVPEFTCVQGDELRSTNAGPAAASDRTTDISDAKYSIGALTRMETIVAQIVQGSDVTESSGNIEIQSADWPYADATAAADAQRLVRTIQQNIDFRLNSNILASYTLPTGYNSAYLTGYGDARTLIKENRAFAKEELIAFISENYPTVKYSRTKCRRDVGYIIDALIYDLTYGGNSQSVIAALAYFDGPGSEFAGIFAESAIELTATIASYERLKIILQQIAANTTVSKTTGNNATQWTDTTNLTGGSAASSFIGANIDIIINILTAASTTGAPSVTVTSITGSNTAVTGSAHGLAAGDSFTPRSTANGFVSGTTYWVLTAPSATEFTVSETFGGSTHTLTNGTGLSIVGDVVDRSPATNGVTSTTALITAAQTLDAAQESIVTQTTAYIAANFPTLVYNSAKCERDVRLILEAVMFDFMFNSNDQTLRAGYSYLRSTASDVYTLGQKTATRGAFAFAKDLAKANVGGNATAQARIETLMTTLDDVVFSGSNEGSRCATANRMLDYAVLQLERNRDYIVAEIDAWIDSTFTDTVTAVTGSTDVLTVSDTSWMQRNAAIRFSGTVFGGVSTDITYYVQNVVSATTFKIATARNSNTALDITADDTGSMTVSLFYNSALCLRDVNSYIDALKYDLKYPGNYKSLYAARYYANASLGSLEEDMFYLRDATGLRDMTMQGLTGDLLAPNEYGTSRVSAGAYASLDPGWGPEDYRTWIVTRSPYVQGLTTFGTAAIGQKIDGALHNGGNDSIVSNDFTQVISDGIGAWVANNGRAELVSVFSYYAHIGYLCTEGGRIRGTNGNNSYGDFGAVAEGFDATETPGTAVVDNRFQFVATVGSVFGDGTNKFFNLEFDNAGIDYTEIDWTFTGGGTNADSENDEFRDDAVFQVRLLDLGDDSSGQFGGDGYLTNANTAQGGTSTSITLAATDGELSSAYIGMVVYLTGGAGVGQYGYITTYNTGTKIAAVTKEDGTPGFEHVVPGTTIATPDASTTYVVEPRITFSAPGFSDANADLPAAGTWTGVTFGYTNASYVSLTGTYSGTEGSGATFTVIRNGYKYIPVIQSAGTGYNRLETITIAGTSLGGLSTDNDLVITITAVNSSTGAILEFDQDGYGIGGTFVAVQSGSRQTATSQDGTSWTDNALALPSTASWSDVAYGTFNDGSTLERTDTARFVAIATGGTSAAYSTNGVSWTASTLPASANWNSVTFGNGRFVAVASDSTTVAVSFDGEAWDVTGTLPSTGFVSVAYGAGYFVAVKTGDTGAVAYSTTGSGNWTADDMPASSTWTNVTWGNNKFVAVASDSNDGAYSLDFGQTWSAMTIGSADGSSVSSFQKVKYGQGLFLSTVSSNDDSGIHFVAKSENGIDWSFEGIEYGDSTLPSGFNALAFGNPQRTGKWAVLPKDSEQTSAWIRTGATARARAFVAEEKIFAIRITEPGSGYDTTPTMTVTDPNNTFELPFSVRTGKGVLAQPSWTNRGAGYTTASAEVNTGDGYADFFQSGGFVAVRRMSLLPVAGSNVVFAGLPGRTFKLVNVITFLGTNAGAFTSFYQISPVLSVQEATSITHLSGVETRIRYSQVRLTGHDFLDIGTGSFIETNYPGLPTQDPIQANETVEGNGGRVFFTSTDQDGNFRVGDLFSIEQSTGVATLNADAFNISGLQELNLGNVTLGGGSATITEFSTDPFFTADSDSVIPTQRAIKAFIASQIGGGGASLNVNSVTAGSIKISSNQIENITGTAIKMNAVFEFRGGVTGLPIAFHYFMK